MLDTIHLTLHDLDTHKGIFDFLVSNENSNQRHIKEVDLADYENVRNISRTKTFEFLTFADTGETRLLKDISFKRIPSSHYKLYHTIDILKDTITFNFSIPKYLFGNNIAQFIPSPFSKSAHYHNTDLESQSKFLYSRLSKFIKSFFTEQFVDLYVDYSKVQVSRLDLCFNQIFQCKKDALTYLEMQKKIPKKNIRENSATRSDYKTSISYKNDSYTYKIYHKGSEYRSPKGDKKKHIKINSDLKKAVFDIEYFEQLADRMLRYEIEFHNVSLSKIYNHKYFRKNSKIHKQQYAEYRRLDNEKRKYFRYLKNPNKTVKVEPLPRQAEKFRKRYERALGRRHQLFLKVSNHISIHERIYTDNSLCDRFKEGSFNSCIVENCFKIFYKFLKDYQINEMPPMNKIISTIDNNNLTVTNRRKQFSHLDSYLSKEERNSITSKTIYKSSMITGLKLLEHYTLDEIKSMGLMERSTFYRFKSKLKKIGVTDNTVSGYSTIPNELSFSTYYGEPDIDKLYVNKYSLYLD